MLLQMAILLAIASTAVEGFFAWHVPRWRHFTRHHRLLDLGFSFFLSYILGYLFQVPGGLVVFMGAVISTIISMPMYPILDWCEENKGLLHDWMERGRELAADCVRLMYTILRLLTLPFRVARWCHNNIFQPLADFKASVTPSTNPRRTS